MKERPILFSGPMVRAILEGRKTVTRRAVKDQPRGLADIGSFGPGQPFIRRPEPTKRNLACPYGRPGDRLWVRETWEDVHPAQVADGRYSQLGRAGIPGPPAVTYRTIYRAEGPYPQVYQIDQPPYRALEPDPSSSRDWPADNGWTGWTPSIHMPRWASRILLEITAVRVERLQDISEEQAVAEGCFFTDYGRRCGHGGKGWQEVGDCPAPEAHHPQNNGWMWDKTTSSDQCLGSARWAFGNLWEKTGGDWDANPWVWVVEFKRVTP
ncbi:hypothetical protein [Pseudomonas citronellolis]|uniref:hypothetical protein n=1 Tax=Pseudomonas citronellolis TaxID=53408 RepID=UPI0023E4734C|nr:hypothetical protein [Pseudomonas citronellolis]MDF3933510.1 hypothetical protein [Pseudomonas citronellolis]